MSPTLPEDETMSIEDGNERVFQPGTTSEGSVVPAQERPIKCAARAGSTGANDPQDCEWPNCGCDVEARPSSPTPGPWTAEYWNGTRTVVKSGERFVALTCLSPRSEQNPHREEADTRLIAAAPELLEALRQTLTAWAAAKAGDIAAPEWMNAAEAVAKAAIAKATRP